MFIYGEWWMFVAGFMWWQFIAATSISAGYHRYFSHNAFKTGAWYPYYVQWLALFANPGPVLTWASAHRMHHFYSDTEKDPHSPIYKGFWKSYLSMWGDDISYIEKRALRNLSNRPGVKFFHRHYFVLLYALAIVLFVIHPLLFLFGLALPIVFAFHGYGLINAFVHRKGHATNSALANILTGGEGWHENHHRRPGAWRIGETKWQLDPGAWFIKAIKQ